jgi:hypothetical protein
MSVWPPMASAVEAVHTQTQCVVKQHSSDANTMHVQGWRDNVTDMYEVQLICWGF